jgi:hypothetical protein
VNGVQSELDSGERKEGGRIFLGGGEEEGG